MNYFFSLFDPWKKYPHLLPDVFDAMNESITFISNQSNQMEALQVAYNIVTKKYQSYRILTFIRLDCLFIRDVRLLWNKRGFLHCHYMNYVFRLLLVKSGWFSNSNIQTHWTQIWLFSPHQYLTAQLKNGRKIEIDPWGRAYGIPLGSHAHGFSGGTIFAHRQ